MSCNTYSFQGRWFRYLISILKNLTINTYATITNVNGTVQVKINADTNNNSITFNIGPFAFTSNISTTQQITVTVYANNAEVAKFTLSGISATAGQQYILSVTFTHTTG